MAGDLPFEEVLVVHGDFGAAATEGALVESPAPSGRVVQRFGERVEIRLGAGDGTGAVLPDIPDSVLESLSETERFGVEALQLRASPEFVDAKANRPREGEVWDMSDCRPADVAELRREALGADAGAPAPTSSWLTGSVALGVVIVNGPTAATQFTAAERTKIVAEVQAGAGWLAGFNRWAGVSFSYDVRNVSIATQPERRGHRQREPLPRPRGRRAGLPGQLERRQRLRQSGCAPTGTRTGRYCVFFVKGYPVDHFAYASIGGPRIVMEYANDGWGPDNIDRVFAHESGHIFGGPDEYASSGCNCGGSWGRFGEPTPTARTAPARPASAA